MLQFQTYDDANQWGGGLYIIKDEICAIKLHKQDNKRLCKIFLKNGQFFVVLDSVSEVLEKMGQL